MKLVQSKVGLDGGRFRVCVVMKKARASRTVLQERHLLPWTPDAARLFPF